MTVSRKGFDLDLLEGELAETEFAAAIVNSRVEHKRDHQAWRTGNVFVEFSQPTGASGIARELDQRETAGHWAFQYADACWIVLPSSLLRALCLRAWREQKVRSGGDHGLYKGVLIPVAWLVNPWVAVTGEDVAA